MFAMQFICDVSKESTKQIKMTIFKIYFGHRHWQYPFKKGFQQNFKFAVAIHKAVDCDLSFKHTKERIWNQWRNV